MVNLDKRYNNPKGEPTVDPREVQDVINTNDIYSQAKHHILNAQARQVAYGLEKYPEPLNPNSWSTVETIDHIIEESVDKLHYLVMLKLKIIKELEEVEKEKELLNQSDILSTSVVEASVEFIRDIVSEAVNDAANKKLDEALYSMQCSEYKSLQPRREKAAESIKEPLSIMKPMRVEEVKKKQDDIDLALYYASCLLKQFGHETEVAPHPCESSRESIED